jgi:hypothetical protein
MEFWTRSHTPRKCPTRFLAAASGTKLVALLYSAACCGSAHGRLEGVLAAHDGLYVSMQREGPADCAIRLGC